MRRDVVVTRRSDDRLVKLIPWLALTLVVASFASVHLVRDPAPSLDNADVPAHPASRRAAAVGRAERVRASGEEAPEIASEVPTTAADSIWNQPLGVVGVVRTEDGTPVPGAFVALGDLDASEDTALTDATGSFGIDQFPSYSHARVVALLHGATWRGEEPADGAPIKVDVTVRRHDAADDRVVLVHVVGHDGGSIPRATVEAVGGVVAEPWRWDTRNVLTASGGWFPVRAKRWREGERPVFLVGCARDDQDSPLSYSPALVTVNPQSFEPVEVRLPPGTSIAGVVESADGRPAEGIVVTLNPAAPQDYDAARMLRPRELTTRTDAAGRFRFGALASGTATIRIDAKPDAHEGCAARDVQPGGGDLLLQLRERAAR